MIRFLQGFILGLLIVAILHYANENKGILLAIYFVTPFLAVSLFHKEIK